MKPVGRPIRCSVSFDCGLLVRGEFKRCALRGAEKLGVKLEIDEDRSWKGSVYRFKMSGGAHNVYNFKKFLDGAAEALRLEPQ